MLIIAEIAVLPLNSGLKVTCSAVALSLGFYFLRWIVVVVKIQVSSLPSEQPYQPGNKWNGLF